MNIVQIEKNLQKLMKSFDKETFIYDLLLAYGLPKASITRLQKGNLNLSKEEGELSWKKKVFFKEEYEKDLHISLLELSNEVKHDQRFVIVTDYKLLLAIDTKTQDKLDVDFKDLAKNYDFFLPWAGMEKTQHQNENPADVKAAERMAKLFDEIKKDNPTEDEDFNHGLNVFLSRLLFCFFAEDTDIFEDNQFTNAISSHTQADGSDLGIYLDELFEVLNTPDSERKDLPTYLEAFPYVNGGLFRQRHSAPEFSRKSRQLIIEAGELDWKGINPDIFGSMFQGVIDPGKRGSLGAHYTSVPNIMKVIEPLFLDELYEAFEKAKGNSKKMKELLHRLSQIKIFDPACGSGNFLIIAYKELKRLEMKIFNEINEMAFSQISLSQFYGIELDDFAYEIAQLSLWLAEHQMNVEFFKQFGRTNPTLPLKEAGKIVCGNACRLDWRKVCSTEAGEVYILGNPPYLGARLQNDAQKSDVSHVFKDLKGSNNLDYIACWFKKGGDYILHSNSKFAFVTTNSINQGEQVPVLWPSVLVTGLKICFAHPSFKWDNNAKSNAAVIVAIIGVTSKVTDQSYLYFSNHKVNVDKINPYLIEGETTYIKKSSRPISKLPTINFGSMANDGGYLMIEKHEKEQLIEEYPETEKFIRKIVGSVEFIRGYERYCLWIKDNDLELARSIPPILSKIDSVRRVRESSKRKATNLLGNTPHKFGEIRYEKSNSVLIPRVSSASRTYVPMGFLGEECIISDSAFAMYNAEPWHLGVLSSKLHMVWLKTVGGRLKMDYRYSASLVYNTFPFPEISQNKKDGINQAVLNLLQVRESYSDRSLSDLYNPEKMPKDLKDAHLRNDLAVEKCLKEKPFNSDEERLEYLFKFYKRMIKEKK